MAVSVLYGAFSHKEGSTTVDQRREADTVRGTDTTSRPYAFFVVALALVSISVTFLLIMLMFRRAFLEQPETVIMALGSLFTVVGTVIGAYFGIKVASDTTDKTRGTIERANDTTNRALAALPPEEGKRITETSLERPAGPAPERTSESAPESTQGQPAGPTPKRPPGQPGR